MQILPANRTRQSFGEKLTQGIGTGLDIASKLMQQHEQKKAMAQEEQTLNKMGIDVRGLSPELKKVALSEKLKSDGRNTKTNEQIDFENKNYSTLKDVFGDRFADVWKASTEGGKTQLLTSAIEHMKRGGKIQDLLKTIEPSQNQNENEQDFSLQNEDLVNDEFEKEEVPVDSEEPNKNQYASSVNKEMMNHLKSQDEGLLPSEKISRGKERFDSGIKQYQEAGTKLRSIAADKDRLNILETLNKTKKLPKDLGRLNVDSEGNLRAPFLANEETQRYVKVLNEFSSSAKDTFGSRVTNFDLAQYLKRFPTLMNTEEGRNQILDQMKIVNQMNSVYYKNLKNVYDKAGGVRNIDTDVAERYAEKLSEPSLNKLSMKFKEIGKFTSKPTASEFKGKKIKDTNTGEVFISDGKDWIPAE